MKSLYNLQKDIIQYLVTNSTISVSTTDTTTNIYKALYPSSRKIEELSDTIDKLRYAMSFLGAQGENLNKLIKDINCDRLTNETDKSIKQNCPKIFIPESDIVTEIDENLELFEDEVEIKNYDNILREIKSVFAENYGLTTLPLILPKIWAAVAFILDNLYMHLDMIKAGRKSIDSQDISNTKWVYEFAAKRVKGCRDAEIVITSKNELTAYIQIETRPYYDSNNVKKHYEQDLVMEACRSEIEKYYPREKINKPIMKFKRAITIPLYVDIFIKVSNGTSSSIAKSNVETATDNFIYNTQTIGKYLNFNDLKTAILLSDGVDLINIAYPQRDLYIKPNEIIIIGFTNVREF